MPHLLLALFCFLIATHPVRSATSGRIEGVVQQEGKAIANHRIMLIRFGPGQEVNRTPGDTDAQGGFAFEGLETGDAFTYVVGIRYEDQLFRSESVQLSDDEPQKNVVLQVGGAGTPPALSPGADSTPIHISNHIMAIVWREGRLEIREIVNIENPASTPYQGEASGHRNYVLHLSLPDGYEDLRDIQGVAPEHIRSDRFGLYLTQPLAPGSHRLIYNYAVPMPHRVRTLLLRPSLPTGIIDVFADAKQLVATSNFQFLGEVPIQSHTFLHFRGPNPEAGARHWIQVVRLGAYVNSTLRLVSYTSIIAIALMGLVIPLYNQWRCRSRAQGESAPSAAAIQAWQAERAQLLWAIAQLDNAQTNGTLDEALYRQRRQAYKRQLRRVAEELYRANQPLEMPSLVTGAMPKGLP
jgi:hypothetical protein